MPPVPNVLTGERMGHRMNEKLQALSALDETIRLRRENPQEGSYTCYLFEKGIDKILKKC